MKKLLLFASVIALMTSCAKTNLTGDAPQAPAAAKGIYFAPSIADDAPASKANFDKPAEANAFKTNWFSDKDRIGVIFSENGIGVVDPLKQPVVTATSGWFGKQGTANTNSLPFAFKASLSGVAGHFAAASDADVLTVINNGTDDKSVIRAYWPLTDGNKGQDLADVKTAITGTGTKIALPKLAAQTQTTVDGYGIVENSFMVAQTTFKTAGKDKANDNSITAERLPLTFHRISPVAWIKITSDKVTPGVGTPSKNTEYVRDYVMDNRFGNLKTVSLTAKGLKKTDGTGFETTPAPSKLTYNAGDMFDIAKTGTSEEYLARDGFITSASPDATSSITTTLGASTGGVDDGLEWNNDATVFMSIANVNREAFRKSPETMETAVNFANMHFTKQFTTNKDWSVNLIPNSTGGQVAANWYRHPEIDIDAMPYIVYEYKASKSSEIKEVTGEYVLQINPSFVGIKLASIFDENGVKEFFSDAAGARIAKSAIKHIVAKVALTPDDLKFVNDKTNGLTNLKYVTLLANDNILAEAFNNLKSVQYWNLPKVKTVDNVNAFASTVITDVYMGSFNFNEFDQAIHSKLLVKENLQRADISSVPSIAADYPKQGLNFAGFADLEEIRVQDNVYLGGGSFSGCSMLTTVQYPIDAITGVQVKGAVNLGYMNVNKEFTPANAIFSGCKLLSSINIYDKVIPSASFLNCSVLTDILDAKGGAIVPQGIYGAAFKGCANLKDMNLEDAKFIGESAFESCTMLSGNTKWESGDTQHKNTLSVNGITFLDNKVFAGCTNLKFLSFASVTQIGLECFPDAMIEIRFSNNITVKGLTKTNSNLFGNATGTVAAKLYHGKGQPGLSSVSTLTLTGDEAGSEKCATTFTGGVDIAGPLPTKPVK